MFGDSLSILINAVVYLQTYGHVGLIERNRVPEVPEERKLTSAFRKAALELGVESKALRKALVA